jgi:hypothetical protein
MGSLHFINREAEVWDITNRRLLSERAGDSSALPATEIAQYRKLAGTPYFQGLVEVEMFGDSPLLDDEMFKEIAVFGTYNLLEEYRVQNLAFSEEKFEHLKGECQRLIHERRSNAVRGAET